MSHCILQLFLQGKKVLQETMVFLVSLVSQVHLVPLVLVPQVPLLVVWYTPGGGGPHVQTSLEHNSCMLEELSEAGTTTREEEPTACPYLMTRAIYSTYLDLQIRILYMALSMRHHVDHFQHFITTMCRVQCAMLPPGEQC